VSGGKEEKKGNQAEAARIYDFETGTLSQPEQGRRPVPPAREKHQQLPAIMTESLRCLALTLISIGKAPYGTLWSDISNERPL
jgi:hypothetical protein